MSWGTVPARRTLRPALAVGLLLLALLVTVPVSTPAHASCAFEADDPELAELAAVIFTGEIVSDTVSGWRKERQVVFAVDRVYKGQAHAEQLVVSTTNTSISLGREISGSGRFLIQAQNGDTAWTPGVLTATSCSGSRAGEAPASMGPGYLPVPGSTIEAQERRVTSGAGLAGLILLIAAGGLVLKQRRGSAALN